MKKETIHRDQTKGKHIEYFDNDSKQRVGKVIKIKGNYLTVKNSDKIKHRIHGTKIKGVYIRGKLHPIFFPRL